MSGGASGSISESKSEFGQDVFGPQAKALRQLYNSGADLFQNSNQQMQSMIPGATEQMANISNQANPAWMNQLQGGRTANMGLQNMLGQSLGQSMAGPSNMQEINNMIMGGQGNNYADAMRGQYVRDANQAQENMLSNLDSRAAAAGMSGGSRHGVATAQGMRDINKNLQRNMAETGYNTFDKDLDRKLQIAGMADQGTLARQQMMSNMIGRQDTAQQGAINAGQNMQNMTMGRFAPSMAPWQAMGAYGNTIGGPTVLSSGSAESKSTSQSAGGGM